MTVKEVTLHISMGKRRKTLITETTITQKKRKNSIGGNNNSKTQMMKITNHMMMETMRKMSLITLSREKKKSLDQTVMRTMEKMTKTQTRKTR